MTDFDYLRQCLSAIFRKYGVRKAVLFGSCAKGSDSARSDVDLCLDSGLRGMKFVGLVEEIRKCLGGREVDALDVAHIDKGSKVAREIERTGVVIYEQNRKTI